MKQLLIPVLAGLALSCAQTSAQSQEHREKISKEFTATANTTLVIYNINGLINVEGSGGNTVSFDVDKRLTAKTSETLEEGKREFKLAIEQKGDTIVAYIAEPFDSRPNRNKWDDRNDRRIDYDFTLDFTVKVPRGARLNVSTINRGDVTVRNVAGTMRVRNINGAIRLTNAQGPTDAHTINGNVEADYTSSPAGGSSYYTLNGDIKVSYPASTSADLQFKSFQGEFFTDFPEVQVLPVQVVKNEEKRSDKTVYKLSQTTSMRIGSGGQTYRFETFNGNVYIRKQS